MTSGSDFFVAAPADPPVGGGPRRPIVIAYVTSEADEDRFLRATMTPEVVVHIASSGPLRPRGVGRPIILLGIGSGCADLARDLPSIDAGLLRAIVLVGPEAPWAEHRVPPHNDRWMGEGAAPANAFLSLGPIEPLRAWAAIARGETSRTCCRWHAGGGRPSTPCMIASPREMGVKLPRLIITAHPEPVACGACGGAGDGDLCDACERNHAASCEHRGVCSFCSGTGRSLGPAEVARELIGDPIEYGRQGNGLFYLRYTSRADHDREAIGAALTHALAGLR